MKFVMPQWTVHPAPVPLANLPTYQLYYLSVCPPPSDPTIVWGTEVRMEPLEAYLRKKNSSASQLISPSHFLYRNVALAMQQHPEFNRRIARRRVFEYKSTSLLIPVFTPHNREITTLPLENVPDLTLEQIAEYMWQSTSAGVLGTRTVEQLTPFERLPRWFIRLGLWFHIWNHNTFNFPRMKMLRRENVASMIVNYYGARNTPPLKSYKPSRFPLDGVPFSITMGATVDQPVVENGQVIAGRVAPLYLRADHRLVDAYLMKVFIETMLKGFARPEQVECLNAAPIKQAA